MKRSRRPAPLLLLFAALTVVAFFVHLNVGSYAWYTPWRVLEELFRGPSENPSTENFIIWTLRLPRAVCALLVGATLGLVGSAFQAQFRNPLAEPYVVGVSSGAAVGGVIALVTGLDSLFGGLGTMVLGFLGGIGALSLVYGLARRRGVVDVTTLLLAGVVVGSLLSAVLSMVLLGAGRDTNAVLGWLLGSMTNILWNRNAILAVTLVVGAVILVRESRRMNALAMGEETASRLGVDVARMRWIVLLTGSAMTAAAVGAVGIIGFLGLVAPHIARRLLGVDWRLSLVGSGVLGAGILLLADLIAQRGLSTVTGTAGMEIPVGIVTAVLGAPSLLILLRRTGYNRA